MGYLASKSDGTQFRVSRYTKESGNILYVDEAGGLWDESDNGQYLVSLGRQAAGGAADYDSAGDPAAAASPATPITTYAHLHSFQGGMTRSGWNLYHDPASANINAGRFGRYSNTLNEYLNWHIWLDRGTYTLDMLDYLSSHFGKGKWSLDGVDLFEVDQSASNEWGVQFWEAGSFAVASSGMHDLRYRCLDQAGVSTADTKYVGLCGAFLRGGRVGLVPFPQPALPFALSNGTGWAGSSTGRALLRSNQTNPGGMTVSGGGFAPAAGNRHGLADTLALPLDIATHAATYWIEQEVYLDAGTYAFDMEALIGTVLGVARLDIDGVAKGTPQPANTVRPLGATSTPGNGNKAGAALLTGEIDLYDKNTSLPAGQSTTAVDGGTWVWSPIPDALTGIVVPDSGFKTVRFSCVGKNSAALQMDLAIAGNFRRTA